MEILIHFANVHLLQSRNFTSSELVPKSWGPLIYTPNSALDKEAHLKDSKIQRGAQIGGEAEPWDRNGNNWEGELGAMSLGASPKE